VLPLDSNAYDHDSDIAMLSDKGAVDNVFFESSMRFTWHWQNYIQTLISFRWLAHASLGE
jgi:hypothetical protein